MIKLFKGSWCLRLCYGNPEVKPVRKPGLTVWVWAVFWWKGFSPSSDGMRVTNRVAPGWSDRGVSGTLDLWQSLLHYYILYWPFSSLKSAATSIQCYCNLKRKDHTTWVKQKNSKTNCTRGSSNTVYFFHCPFNHKYIQFSLKLIDGESHLIGPEITFFYNWLRVQTWKHKLRSQTEGH